MPTCQLEPCGTLAVARLLIHADGAAATGPTRLAALWHQLHHLYTMATHAVPPSPLQVRIADLQGHCVFVNDAAGPLLDLPLPAGTYQITAQLGTIRRSYTTALLPGGSFNLHLRLAAALQGT